MVYVDDTSIAAGDVAWAKDLANKLKATLTPGERVTVVELSPSQGTSNELWSACWPDYTAAMKAKLAKGSYFFTSNPLNGLNRQQGFFLNGFGQALTKIYMTATRKERTAPRAPTPHRRNKLSQRWPQTERATRKRPKPFEQSSTQTAARTAQLDPYLLTERRSHQMLGKR